MAVGADDRILEANAPAKALIPTLRAGVPLASHMRSPRRARRRRAPPAPAPRPRGASWLERVPVERLFEVAVTPRRRSRLRADRRPLPPRGVRGPAVRAHARRLHRQRQPRASHAAVVAARLHRDLAGAGAQGRQGRATGFLGHHARAGAADGAARRRPCCRCRASSSTSICNHATASISSRWCATSPTRLTPLAQDSEVTLAIEAAEPVAVAGDRDELMRVAEKPHRERDQIRRLGCRRPPRRHRRRPRADRGGAHGARFSASASRPSTCPG